MLTGFKHLHSYFAYLLLAVLIIGIIFNFLAFMQGKSYSNTNRKFALYGLMATHIQVLFGLILYFVSPLGISALSGEAMKDSTSRLYALEHPLMMILAAVLVTIGYSKSKKAMTDARKFRIQLAFYGVALIFILSRIPWAAWPH